MKKIGIILHDEVINNKTYKILNTDFIKYLSNYDVVIIGIIYDEETDINKILEQISKDKRKKVINFFIDYNEVFREMARVLKQNSLIVLTVGNRRVDNIVVELDKISIELAELYNLSLDVKLNREIPSQRMPKKLSSVGELGAVESMNKEIILIFRKTKIDEGIYGEV